MLNELFIHAERKKGGIERDQQRLRKSLSETILHIEQKMYGKKYCKVY